MSDRAVLLWIAAILAMGTASFVWLLLTGDARALLLCILAGWIFKKANR